MAIRLEKTEKDEAGFPIVSWWEDRHILHAGRGVRVWCYLTPHPETKRILFATTGSDPRAEKFNFRPWDYLTGFSRHPASVLYQQPLENVILDRSKLKVFVADHAFVTTADFEDDKKSVPMHLNRAVASEHDWVQLHDELRRNFIQRRDDLVEEICARRTPFIWPADKKPFVPPVSEPLPKWADTLATVLVVIFFAAVFAGIGWFVGVLNF